VEMGGQRYASGDGPGDNRDRPIDTVVADGGIFRVAGGNGLFGDARLPRNENRKSNPRSSHTLLRRLRQRRLIHRLKATTPNAPLEVECAAGDLALLVLREVQDPKSRSSTR
jgi:hypothetical protein